MENNFLIYFSLHDIANKNSIKTVSTRNWSNSVRSEFHYPCCLVHRVSLCWFSKHGRCWFALARTSKPNILIKFHTTLFWQGHGNEADFLGFLQKLVPQFLRVSHTTFRAVPILASNLRRYSYSKNDSALLLSRVVATPRITDTESRLLNFSKGKLSVSMIRRVVDSPHQWYCESSTPRITNTESRRLRVSLSRGVNDSAYRWYGESLFEKKISLASIFSTLNS